MPPERLQKILSRAGVSSRRQAEELIIFGKVQVNGKVVRQLGTKADPEMDQISVDGKPVILQHKHHYYAYYKPRGIMVTKRDDFGRETVFDLLQLPPEVNSVGRLDKESEGLLILSDDGEFVQQYTHPSFEVPKLYHVQISRRLLPPEKKQLLEGVVLELEEKKVRAARIRSLELPEGIWIEMELREGIKREIRRMLKTLGVQVLRLIRVKHGSVRLGDLAPGEILELPRRPY